MLLGFHIIYVFEKYLTIVWIYNILIITSLVTKITNETVGEMLEFHNLTTGIPKLISTSLTTSSYNQKEEKIFRVDPLALLSATLRTYQKAVCDTDQVILTCPRGTSISIEIAQYTKQEGHDGITVEDLCPLQGDKANNQINLTTTNSNENSNIIYKNNIISNTTNNHNISLKFDKITNNTNEISQENCMWPNAFQYSLLQTVVEACQKKKHCKFNATPNRYGLGSSGVGDVTGSSSYYHRSVNSIVDPCPRVRRFVEIIYKCRPYEFRSKVACENDIVQLECNPYSRIAVYSASFGRTEYESIQCPQPQGVREETCLAAYATETVMQICHGRRKCHLAADPNTFGSPCQKNSRVYLKVVYTCVPKQVLKERYESVPETDEPENFEGDINDLYEDDQYYKESEAIPKLQSNLTSTTKLKSNGTFNTNKILNNNITYANITSTLEPMIFNINSDNPIMTHSKGIDPDEGNESIYLLLLIIATVCILFCVIVIAGRLILQRKQQQGNTISRNSSETDDQVKSESKISEGLKTKFNDTILENDNNLNLTMVELPNVSKNESYIAFGPISGLYGNLEQSSSLSPTVNVTNSTTLQQSLAGNTTLPRQSPDIIGATNSTFTSRNNNPGNRSNINANKSHIGNVCPQSTSGSDSSKNGTIPITSIAPYSSSVSISSVPSVIFHPASTMATAGTYIIDNNGTLRRQKASIIQIRPSPGSSPSGLIGSSSTPDQQSTIVAQLQPSIMVIPPQPIPSQQRHVNALETFNYDGTAPRTLSTGVAQNSQFYYG